MGKIKLKESQIEMLQALQDQLPNKKVLKLTAEQCDRLFESNNFEFDTSPKATRPSSKVTKNFKKGGSDIPDGNIRFEAEQLGHPIGGNGGDEYNPQTDGENIKTHMSFNEMELNGAGPTDIIDFGQQIIRFLKGLLSDPDDERVTSFWKEIGVTKDELTEKMFELGMISHGIINDKKIIRIMKDNFLENVKTLYKEYIPEMDEGMMMMGNDMEMEGDNMDVKKNLSKQISKKPSVKPSGDEIKKKLAHKRTQELKRRQNETEGSVGGQIVGFEILKHSPFSELPNTRGEVDWKNRGKTTLPDLKGGDSSHGVTEKEFVVRWVKSFTKMYGEKPVFGLNPEAGWQDQVKVLNPKFNKSRTDYVAAKSASLDKFGTTENEDVEETTMAAGSSGAFVGKMGAAPIGKVFSANKPADEMKKIVGEYDNVAEEANLGNLKYNNFQHPSLGMFTINGIHDTNETEETLSYMISLSDGGEKESKNHLIYSYNKMTGEDKIMFNQNFDKLYDVYKLFDDVYKLVFDGIKEALRPNGVQEQGIGGGGGNPSGSYETPKFWAKDKKNMRFAKDTMYPKGKVVDPTIKESAKEYPLGAIAPKNSSSINYRLAEGKQKCGNCSHFNKEKGSCKLVAGKIEEQYTCDIWDSKGVNESNKKVLTITESQHKMLVETAGDNLKDTAYPEGGFVEIDDCTKLNNNKEAQNGGCSTGSVDNVVKVKQTKDSVISDEAVYYEVAKKTGRTLDEVKNIIQNQKG